MIERPTVYTGLFQLKEKDIYTLEHASSSWSRFLFLGGDEKAIAGEPAGWVDPGEDDVAFIRVSCLGDEDGIGELVMGKAM